MVIVAEVVVFAGGLLGFVITEVKFIRLSAKLEMLLKTQTNYDTSRIIKGLKHRDMLYEAFVFVNLPPRYPELDRNYRNIVKVNSFFMAIVIIGVFLLLRHILPPILPR